MLSYSGRRATGWDMIERDSYRSSDNPQQIHGAGRRERLWPPVIKNEQIETRRQRADLGVKAIGAAECGGR